MAGPDPTFRVLGYAEILDEYEADRSAPSYHPVRLGFGTYDGAMRGGVNRKEVLGFVARTSVGKSFLIKSVVHNVTARDNIGILELSLEMPAGDWAERALAIHEAVAPAEVERWAKQKKLKEHSQAFLERMKNVCVIDDPVRLEHLPIAIQKAREWLGEIELWVMMIDYLGMIGSDGRSEYERVNAVSDALKTTAKVEDIAIILAAQLSRAAGDGTTPVELHMIRDSGKIEEGLDYIIGAWRPGKDDALSVGRQVELGHVMRTKLLKNRRGPDGQVVDLHFFDTSRRLYEPADLQAVDDDPEPILNEPDEPEALFDGE